MGGSQSQVSSIGTCKGQGYRILSTQQNSPLSGQVEAFFDFIIDAVPLKQQQVSTKDILNKLTEDRNRNVKTVKRLQTIFAQNENSPVSLRVVSTKYRNARTVQVVPNRDWGSREDLLGFQTRLQRYDQVFDMYVPFSDIRPQSPVNKAGIQQGEFLIGCRQFRYDSINQLLENVYQRYFDKQYEDKHINLAVYSLNSDQLRVVPVLLSRNWGEKGLLGCQFVEGQLSKFPKNLQQTRQALTERKKKSEDLNKVKKQLSQTNGASSELLESLKIHKNRKKRNISQLRNILFIEPQLPSQHKAETIESGQNKNSQYVSMDKYRHLQSRVATLEEMLSNIRSYVQKAVQEQDEA